jgi:hypothetical protein
MKRTATTEQAEDSNAAGTHALTREQRCGARGKPGRAETFSGGCRRLQQEYDEQVSTVSQCDSTHMIVNIYRLIY